MNDPIKVSLPSLSNVATIEIDQRDNHVTLWLWNADKSVVEMMMICGGNDGKRPVIQINEPS